MGGNGYASKNGMKSGAVAGQTSVDSTTSPAAATPVPTPYPAVSPYGNAAQQDKVKALQKYSKNETSSGVIQSGGDEAGTKNGVQSAATSSKAHVSSTAPVDVSALDGTKVKPSQTKVKVGS